MNVEIDPHDTCGTDPENGLCAVNANVAEAAWQQVVEQGQAGAFDRPELFPLVLAAIGGVQHFLGYQLARPRTFTELELLAAVEAGQVWHEFDHDHVILEDDEGQEEIDEQFRTIHHIASCRGGSVYRLTDEGKSRLAELRSSPPVVSGKDETPEEEKPS